MKVRIISMVDPMITVFSKICRYTLETEFSVLLLTAA